jgi:hypothetical protein
LKLVEIVGWLFLALLRGWETLSLLFKLVRALDLFSGNLSFFGLLFPVAMENALIRGFFMILLKELDSCFKRGFLT